MPSAPRFVYCDGTGDGNDPGGGGGTTRSRVSEIGRIMPLTGVTPSSTRPSTAPTGATIDTPVTAGAPSVIGKVVAVV